MSPLRCTPLETSWSGSAQPHGTATIRQECCLGLQLCGVKQIGSEGVKKIYCLSAASLNLLACASDL